MTDETYPAGARLPPLTRAAPDALCAAWAAREPNLLGRIAREAVAAYTASRSLPGTAMWTVPVDAIWKGCVARVHAVRGQPVELGRTLAARDTMTALAALQVRDRATLAMAAQPGAMVPAAAHAARRAVLALQPALAELLEIENAEAARQAEIQARQQAVQAAEYQRLRPVVLLAALRKRGVAIELDGDRLTVPASASLTDQERAEATACRAGLVALLRAEADAAAEASRRVTL